MTAADKLNPCSENKVHRPLSAFGVFAHTTDRNRLANI